MTAAPPIRLRSRYRHTQRVLTAFALTLSLALAPAAAHGQEHTQEQTGGKPGTSEVGRAPESDRPDGVVIPSPPDGMADLFPFVPR